MIRAKLTNRSADVSTMRNNEIEKCSLGPVDLLVYNISLQFVDTNGLEMLFTSYGFLRSRIALDPCSASHRFIANDRIIYVAVVTVKSSFYAQLAIHNLNGLNWGPKHVDKFTLQRACKFECRDANNEIWAESNQPSTNLDKNICSCFNDWWKLEAADHYAIHENRVSNVQSRRDDTVYFDIDTWQITYDLMPWGKTDIFDRKDKDLNNEHCVQLIDWNATRVGGCFKLTIDTAKTRSLFTSGHRATKIPKPTNQKSSLSKRVYRPYRSASAQIQNTRMSRNV